MNIFKLLIFILVISIAIASIHLMALEYYLYWVIPWLDILVHFMGGFLAGLIGAVTLFYIRMNGEKSVDGRHILFVVLFSALSIGIGWEVFEYVAGVIELVNYPIDTATDIIMDLLGGISVYWVLVHSRVSTMLQ